MTKTTIYSLLIEYSFFKFIGIQNLLLDRFDTVLERIKIYKMQKCNLINFNAWLTQPVLLKNKNWSMILILSCEKKVQQK